MVPSGANSSTYSGYFAIIAYGIVIVLILAISKTKIGYTLLFFFVLASIVLVLAIGSPTIAAIFNAVNPNSQQPTVGGSRSTFL